MRARGEGADNHEQQRYAVDALLAKAVAEPAEEELSHERTAQCDAVHSGHNVGWQRGGVWLVGVDVVDVVELDAEQVTSAKNANAGRQRDLAVL
jgi:hypothetical protein